MGLMVGDVAFLIVLGGAISPAEKGAKGASIQMLRSSVGR